jgi:hypothetical protein
MRGYKERYNTERFWRNAKMMLRKNSGVTQSCWPTVHCGHSVGCIMRIILDLSCMASECGTAQ